MSAAIAAKLVDHLPAAPAPTPSAIDRIIDAALTQDFDVDRIKELYALKQQYDADEARKAFVAALAQFKSEPLRIRKDKHVRFATQKGITEYDHATIGNVVEVITGRLGQFQLAHRWDTKQEGGKITVTCVLTHARGHSESTTLTASPDDSGGKNGIQSIASTITYLQRYTLLAATGMATMDQEDDDGRGSSPAGESDAAQAWADAISGCESLDELQRRKPEIESLTGKVRSAAIKAYNAKLATFKGNSK